MFTLFFSYLYIIILLYEHVSTLSLFCPEIAFSPAVWDAFVSEDMQMQDDTTQEEDVLLYDKQKLRTQKNLYVENFHLPVGGSAPYGADGAGSIGGKRSHNSRAEFRTTHAGGNGGGVPGGCPDNPQNTFHCYPKHPGNGSALLHPGRGNVCIYL